MSANNSVAHTHERHSENRKDNAKTCTTALHKRFPTRDTIVRVSVSCTRCPLYFRQHRRESSIWNTNIIKTTLEYIFLCSLCCTKCNYSYHVLSIKFVCSILWNAFNAAVCVCARAPVLSHCNVGSFVEAWIPWNYYEIEKSSGFSCCSEVQTLHHSTKLGFRIRRAYCDACIVTIAIAISWQNLKNECTYRISNSNIENATSPSSIQLVSWFTTAHPHYFYIEGVHLNLIRQN